MRWMVGSMVGAAALVGCTSPDSVALEHRAELSVQARGVQLSDDGATSHVGMYSTTCEVGTEFAMIGEDFDYDSSDDTVVDAAVVPGTGMTTVVITPDQVHLTTPDAFTWFTDIQADGVLTGRLVDGGVVALQVPPVSSGSLCSMTWFDESGELVTSASDLGVECTSASDLTTDPGTGTAWVSTDSGVIRVSRDGSTLAIDNTPNARLAWDDVANALYVGAHGSTSLTAFEFDGAQRWTLELSGELTSLASMGESGSAAASIELSDGSGEFVVVDGTTGEVSADLPTPSAAQNLDVSRDGSVLAVTLPGAVHYFDILATN